MTARRVCVGGKNGLSIERVEKLTTEGKVVSVWFEVLDSDGNLLGTFDTIAEASDFVDNYQQAPRPPSFRM